MDNKLYVGNLPFSTTEDALRQTFSQWGTVEEVKLITDKYTGRSKGFGFIMMENGEQAQKAIDNQDQKDFEGRAIKVNIAKPMEQRPRNNSRGGDSRGGGFGNSRGNNNW